MGLFDLDGGVHWLLDAGDVLILSLHGIYKQPGQDSRIFKTKPFGQQFNKMVNLNFHKDININDINSEDILSMYKIRQKLEEEMKKVK